MAEFYPNPSIILDKNGNQFVQPVSCTYNGDSLSYSMTSINGETNTVMIPTATYLTFPYGVETLAIELKNESKIYITRRNNSGSNINFGFRLTYPNGSNMVAPDYSLGNNTTNCDIKFIFYEDLGRVVVAIPKTSTYYPNYTFSGNITTFLEGTAPIVYDWKPWEQLKGNNGQYRCNLTMIKSTAIGDITALQYGNQTAFDRISSNADVVPYARNLNYNSPIRLAYSGVNWLTFEIQPDAELVANEVKGVFKFYVKNVSDTTPIYTYTIKFFIKNDDKFYLSFVHDDEQQAAAFTPVSLTTPSTNYYWGEVTFTESEANLLWLWLQASGTPDPDPQPSGPYDNGTTDNGGGGGNPIPQDDIHTPNVPALGAMASGMFTVYCPTDAQLGLIASYLWSDSFIDNIKKYFNNASDNIIALYVLPLEPDGLQTKNFKIGNLENSSITGVKYLNNRFISVPMGSIDITRRWGTYLDFSPFTKFSLYLPGVGVVALDSDDIMAPPDINGYMPDQVGSTISLSYTIDLFTGVLVAYVYINGQIRYQFPGRMGYSIPLTGENYTAMGAGFVQAMAGLATTIATGGTAAPFTAGATAAGIVNAMKPEVYRGGNLSGDASMLSLKTPMLIRSAPNIPELEGLERFTGGPSYKIDTLTNFSGFTQVIEAHIEGISCTSAERDEIMQLLKGGVLL